MNFAEDKKRKIDRLDPIQMMGSDNSRKYLWTSLVGARNILLKFINKSFIFRMGLKTNN
jgi:hypothetical protein